MKSRRLANSLASGERPALESIVSANVPRLQGGLFASLGDTKCQIRFTRYVGDKKQNKAAMRIRSSQFPHQMTANEIGPSEIA
jgi:hypothetical protein